MKKQIIKISCASFIVISIVTLSISCHKEKIENNSGVVKNTIFTNMPKDSQTNRYIIATAQEGDMEAQLLFNKNTFDTLFQEELSKYFSDDYIFDDISIWDENPADMNITPALRLSILNALDGTTHTYFLLIQKNILDCQIVYIMPPITAKENPITVHCQGTNCNGGCGLNARRTGCTRCHNKDGVCNSEVNYSGEINDPDFSTFLEIMKKIIDKLLYYL